MPGRAPSREDALSVPLEGNSVYPPRVGQCKLSGGKDPDPKQRYYITPLSWALRIGSQEASREGSSQTPCLCTCHAACP